MSYLQLNIGGKLRGLKFNSMTCIVFAEEVDWGRVTATAYYAVIYAGLVTNAFAKKEEFTESKETVIDWVEEMSIEDKEAALVMYNNLSQWQELLDKAKETVVEKTPEEKKRKLKSTTTKV